VFRRCRAPLCRNVNDTDELADEWRAVGVELVEPQDFEWGEHEGSHRDPDGNLIRLGSQLRGQQQS
jgi:hypothetical protein